MDFIDKDVLLQQMLEEGKLNDVQKGILFSLNWERTALLQVIGQAIYSLQEARDLLETVTLDAEEDKVVSRMVSVEEKLEAALKIYQEVIKKYPGYCDQFLEATARILNKNYVSPPVDIDEGELPF